MVSSSEQFKDQEDGVEEGEELEQEEEEEENAAESNDETNDAKDNDDNVAAESEVVETVDKKPVKPVQKKTKKKDKGNSIGNSVVSLFWVSCVNYFSFRRRRHFGPSSKCFHWRWWWRKWKNKNRGMIFQLRFFVEIRNTSTHKHTTHKVVVFFAHKYTCTRTYLQLPAHTQVDRFISIWAHFWLNCFRHISQMLWIILMVSTV